MSVFDTIAPIYGIFFDFQVRYYSRIIEKVRGDFDISNFSSILDLGCGTGALCKTLYEKGIEVKGVDVSKMMLKQARKKLNGLPIELININPGQSLPFEDNSFDLSITSYVAHGLKPEERLKLYKEMKRISKEAVIIYDYNESRAPLTTFIEWLERGDYFNFINVAEKEMLEIFSEVKKINVDTRAAWYIGK